jgi:hypothetical protein
VEQVKGSEEMKEKIIAASKDARSLPDYPQELLPDYFTNSVTICDKYLNNYQESHLHTNGIASILKNQGTNTARYFLKMYNLNIPGRDTFWVAVLQI